MKVLVIAVALAAATSFASAGAARDARALEAADKPTTTVLADAGSLTGPSHLTALNGSSAAPWAAGNRDASPDFDALAEQVDPGMLLVALGVAVVALARPVGRLLRRQEQQRRAVALASTLGQQAPRS